MKNRNIWDLEIFCWRELSTFKSTYLFWIIVKSLSKLLHGTDTSRTTVGLGQNKTKELPIQTRNQLSQTASSWMNEVKQNDNSVWLSHYCFFDLYKQNYKLQSKANNFFFFCYRNTHNFVFTWDFRGYIVMACLHSNDKALRRLQSLGLEQKWELCYRATESA